MKKILHTDYFKVGDHMIKMIYSQSDEEAARMREKTINDWNNGMISAKLEGRAEGITVGWAEGIAKNRAEMIKSMQANGLPQELIEKIIKGLPK